MLISKVSRLVKYSVELESSIFVNIKVPKRIFSRIFLQCPHLAGMNTRARMIPENIAKVSALSESIPRHFCVYMCGATALLGPMLLHCWKFREITHTHTHTRARARSLGGTSLDEGSACRRDNWQNTTLIRHIHAPGGIRTRNPNKRAPADPRRRPPGCWDRHQDTSRPKSQRIIEVTSLWPLCSICVGLM